MFTNTRNAAVALERFAQAAQDCGIEPRDAFKAISDREVREAVGAAFWRSRFKATSIPLYRHIEQEYDVKELFGNLLNQLKEKTREELQTEKLFVSRTTRFQVLRGSDKSGLIEPSFTGLRRMGWKLATLVEILILKQELMGLPGSMDQDDYIVTEDRALGLTGEGTIFSIGLNDLRQEYADEARFSRARAPLYVISDYPDRMYMRPNESYG